MAAPPGAGPILQPQLLHPGLKDLGVLGVLRDDAVGGVPDAEAQSPPVAQGAHGRFGLVALREQRGPDLSQVLGPEVARLDAARPGPPLGEGWHRGLLAVSSVEALVVRGVVAVRDRPSRLVKIRVPLVAGEGHGLVLLDGRLVGVDEPAAAADEEHGSAAPGAELPNLQRSDAPLLPALVADGVEVGEDLGQGELQELRQLPGHAEPVVSCLEGAGEDLGAVVQLVADFLEGGHGLPQRDLRLRPVVDGLQGLVGEGPVPVGVVAIGLLAELHDRVAVVRVAQLRQRGCLHAGVGLSVAEAAGLAGEAAVDHGHGQEVLAHVGPPGVAAALPRARDADGDVGQPLRVLVAEEGLAQLGEVVVAVGLQGAHGLLEARAQEDVVGGALADQGLLLVKLSGGGAASHEAVVELARSGELAVGAGQEDLAQAVVGEREPLRALGVRPRSDAALGRSADGFSLLCPTRHDFLGWGVGGLGG